MRQLACEVGVCPLCFCAGTLTVRAALPALHRRQASNEGRAREARLSHALGELEHYKKLLEQASRFSFDA